MKLLLDEMWSPVVAIQLRARGHDVVAVVERPELRGEPDAAIFAIAQAEGRAIVTEDVADYALLATHELQLGHSHVGLLFTSDRHFPRYDGRTAGRLVTALDELLSRELDEPFLEHWIS